MTAWTTKQEETLAQFSHMGPQAAADEIFERFGVRRSAEATRAHGSRIGLSWKSYANCTSCGAPTARPDGAGQCPTCHVRELAEMQRAIADAAERGDVVAEEAAREYARQRKRLSRIRKRNEEQGQMHLF